MNANGTTNTTIATASATASSQYLRTNLMSRSSLRRRNQLSGKHDCGDEHEQDHVAGGREAVEAGLVLLVDRRGEDVGGEAGATAGHGPDQIERAQPTNNDSRITVNVAGLLSGRMT